MAASGVINAGMLGLQAARFDKLEVLWIDEEGAGYVDVGFTMQYLKRQIESDPIANEARLEAIEARLNALEAKVQSLDEQKATKFEAVAPLVLDEGSFPNQLSRGGPSPAAATAVNFAGEDEYIQFDGRTDVLDFTKDWTVGVTVRAQGAGVEATNMTAFSSGGVSLNLKVQGAPSQGSNWGSYNTSNGDLYHTAGRFNSNCWQTPTDDSRLLWVYTAATKKLCYYISYADGSYTRRANISVPDSAIAAQTPGSELSFGKAWSGTGGAAFSGGPYEGVLCDWVVSPHAWTEEELVEYFSVPSDELETLDLWDKVSSFIIPGVYPALVDVKGNLSNGELLNGEPSDFVI